MCNEDDLLPNKVKEVISSFFFTKYDYILVKAEDYTLPSREVTVNSKLPTGKKKKSTKMNIPPRNNGPRNSFDDRSM